MAEMNESQGRLRLGLLGLLLVAGFLILRLTPAGDLFSSQGALDVIVYLRSSAWAPILFVILYTGAVALALPGTILTLTGGRRLRVLGRRAVQFDRREISAPTWPSSYRELWGETECVTFCAARTSKDTGTGWMAWRKGTVSGAFSCSGSSPPFPSIF